MSCRNGDFPLPCYQRWVVRYNLDQPLLTMLKWSTFSGCIRMIHHFQIYVSTHHGRGLADARESLPLGIPQRWLPWLKIIFARLSCAVGTSLASIFDEIPIYARETADGSSWIYHEPKCSTACHLSTNLTPIFLANLAVPKLVASRWGTRGYSFMTITCRYKPLWTTSNHYNPLWSH